MGWNVGNDNPRFFRLDVHHHVIKSLCAFLAYFPNAAAVNHHAARVPLQQQTRGGANRLPLICNQITGKLDNIVDGFYDHQSKKYLKLVMTTFLRLASAILIGIAALLCKIPCHQCFGTACGTITVRKWFGLSPTASSIYSISGSTSDRYEDSKITSGISGACFSHSSTIFGTDSGLMVMCTALQSWLKVRA